MVPNFLVSLDDAPWPNQPLEPTAGRCCVLDAKAIVDPPRLSGKAFGGQGWTPRGKERSVSA